jgi:exodeoxyribonuclease VII large subunit
VSGIDAPPGSAEVLRVAALAGAIQVVLRAIPSGWVEGEVQRLRRPGSGHVYFTLADREAAIECVVWRSRAGRISDWPADGRLVQAHFDRVDFYRRNGRVSLHIDALRLTGEGELLARRAAILARLKAEGLTARAIRALPRFPRRVGLIAGRNSDAKMDVIKALEDRWPAVQIAHRPALMEGVAAVDSVLDALAQLQDTHAVDVIIIARGGGGVAELTAFDDERLCRAIFASPVPVVTSIGHTPQRPNCDHVSAAHADVPARAAELVVPSARDFEASISRAADRLATIPARLGSASRQLAEAAERARPRQTLERRAAEMRSLDGRLRTQASSLHTRNAHALDAARHSLAQARASIPAPGMLDLPAQRLAVSSGRYLDSWQAQLDATGRGLTVARQLPISEELSRLSALLGPAARRARERTASYASAVLRRGDEAARSTTRRLEQRARELADSEDALAQGVRRRTGENRTSLEHLLEVIAARDFRRSGWVLAGDAAGNPVRSTRQLVPDQSLSLRFHDGRATSTVTSVEHEEEARNE